MQPAIGSETADKSPGLPGEEPRQKQLCRFVAGTLVAGILRVPSAGHGTRSVPTTMISANLS